MTSIQTDSLPDVQGELTSAGSWDEFPNGRFGDSKSPAFGVNDLWDNGLGVTVRPLLCIVAVLLKSPFSGSKRLLTGARLPL